MQKVARQASKTRVNASPPPPYRRSPEMEAWLLRVEPVRRTTLRDLRAAIHRLLPEAEECISYRLPAFRVRGSVVAGFSATQKGCSYYPFSGRTLGTLKDDLKGYSQTLGALHFGPDQPIPVALLRKLLKTRIAELG